MKKINFLIFKSKSVLYRAVFMVGLCFCLQQGYTYSQNNINTTENTLKCNVLINPSYAQKLKCSAVAALKKSDSILNAVSR